MDGESSGSRSPIISILYRAGAGLFRLFFRGQGFLDRADEQIARPCGSADRVYSVQALGFHKHQGILLQPFPIFPALLDVQVISRVVFFIVLIEYLVPTDVHDLEIESADLAVFDRDLDLSPEWLVRVAGLGFPFIHPVRVCETFPLYCGNRRFSFTIDTRLFSGCDRGRKHFYPSEPRAAIVP
jgi:hypothetical protein